jgi:di/tricarboxylate transporter
MQPVTPDAHGIAVLLLIVVALILFTRDWLPLESSSLFVLIALIVGFQVFPYEGTTGPLGIKQFVAGFGHEALIAICALLIVGKGLQTTGALQPVANFVSKMWSTRPAFATLLMLVAVAAMSGFINDTPIVVLMIPILVGISLRAKTPVSRVMLPMGLATIVGGMSTTIGTSTNLLVVRLAEDLGVPKIGMFDFFVPALIVGSAGLLFVWLIGPRLLPAREALMSDTVTRVFEAQLFIGDGSYADGRTLSEVLAKTDNRMRVERIQRSDTVFLAKLPFAKLQAGDRLFVRDFAENLKHFEQVLGATLYDASTIKQPIDEQSPLLAEDQQLAEIVVTRDSLLHRRTLAETQFVGRFGALPLAIHRAGVAQAQTIADLDRVRMHAGDVLLLQGARNVIDALKASSNLLVLDGTTDLPPTHRAKRALAVMAFVVLTAALGFLPIAISALLGVGLMVVLGCLSWRDAASSLPIPVIMIIITSLALGKALVGTGMAVYLATGFVDMAAGWPVPVTLSAFLLIMAVLTNIVSNNAAAVIGTPIAIATAQQLNVDPMPFVLAVLFGANMSFATPFGYQTNVLILNAGGYRFSDFVRVGVPLAFIMWVGFSLVLPVLYAVG